jgi:hypothetical protein
MIKSEHLLFGATILITLTLMVYIAHHMGLI